MERQRSLENRNIRPISSKTIFLLALIGFVVTCTLIYLSMFLLGGGVKEPNAQTPTLEEINETPKTQKDGQNEDVSKNKKIEPREIIAVYLSVGLLLISLGYAVLDLYKEKIRQVNAKAQPALPKRCTLADLTVLRHSRKELMRRDSVITEGARESSGDKHSSSLIRRCSLPVIPGDLNHLYLNSSRYGSRRISFDCFHQQHRLSDHRLNHVLLARRH